MGFLDRNDTYAFINALVVYEFNFLLKYSQLSVGIFDSLGFGSAFRVSCGQIFVDHVPCYSGNRSFFSIAGLSWHLFVYVLISRQCQVSLSPRGGSFIVFLNT